jgi:signal transduction histidine kinase
MTSSTYTAPSEALADFWKARYQRQKFLIASITSLLNKYGNSTDLDSLRGTFLLSLMGHYVVGESCCYDAIGNKHVLKPVAAYGSIDVDDLPTIDGDSRLISEIASDCSPRMISTIPDAAWAGKMCKLAESYRVIAPLCLKEQLIGIVFLGEKVLGQAYRDFDFEVLDALCAASATTFNAAVLYNNAKLAATEIQRLFDVRSEVISRISHEFRTPLTVMRGGIEPLQNDSNYVEMHGWLTHALQRLEELIDDLLRLSVEQKDVDNSEFMSYDPMPTIQSAVMAGAERAETRKKNVNLSLTRQPEATEVNLHIGRRDLTSIVRALVDNAVKFTNDSDTVKIEVGLIDGQPDDQTLGMLLPDWEEHTRALMEEYTRARDGQSGASPPQVTPARNLDTLASWLTIQVSDRGIGIPTEEIVMIAEPFRQASNCPQLGVKGKGLGLALVHKIVTQNGGCVYCRSAENEGATFTVILPAT